MGWLLLYAGITKMLNSPWVAAVHIDKTNLLPQFSSFLLRSDVLPYLNVSNKWVLFALGLALVLGFAVRFASLLSLFLMALYYASIYVRGSFVLDEHIVYVLFFLIIMVFSAGNIVGIDALLERLKFVHKRAWIGKLLG